MNQSWNSHHLQLCILLCYKVTLFHVVVSTPSDDMRAPRESGAITSEPPSGGWLQYSCSLFKSSFFLHKVWICYLKLQNGDKVSWLTAELSVRQKNHHHHRHRRLQCQITSARSFASNASQNGSTLLYILPSFYTVGRGGDALAMFIYQWSATVHTAPTIVLSVQSNAHCCSSGRWTVTGSCKSGYDSSTQGAMSSSTGHQSLMGNKQHTGSLGPARLSAPLLKFTFVEHFTKANVITETLLRTYSQPRCL